MTLTAFSLLMWLAQFSPGPDMLLLVQTALRSGRQAALMTVAGIATGLAFHCAVIGSGLGLMLRDQPALLRVLQSLGGLYLMWIGGSLLRQLWRTRHVVSVTGVGPAEGLHVSPVAAFWRGLLTNLLNAKAILFLLSALTAADVAASATRAWLLGGMIVGQAVLGWSAFVWLLTRSSAHTWFQRHQRQWDAFFGIMLVAVGIMACRVMIT
jgi:threonine efflux protein